LETVAGDGSSAKNSSSAPAPPKKAVTSKVAVVTEPPKGDAKLDESVTLNEWSASQQILAWARVQPALADTDLRPYVFVAKDRKEFFGASALGPLAAVVERLMGSKLAAQATESELKNLTPAEGGRVLDAIQARIMIADLFESEPPGVAGLKVLVKAHPALQQQLVDFLTRLPADRVGPWVVGGWTGVVVEAAPLARFEEWIDKLHQNTKHSMVRSAITMRRAKKEH